MIEEMYSDYEQDIYFYNNITKVYEGTGKAILDYGKSGDVGKNQYYRVGSSTYIEPPQNLLDTQVAYFDRDLLNWYVCSDFRGAQYSLNGETIIITKLSEGIPEGATDIIPPPPKSYVKPQYINGEWVETQLFYKGFRVSTKEDVDLITKGSINSLGEEKAKSEKLIAGDGPCEIWDTFVVMRAALLKEGNDFVAEHNLI